ncbi:Fic family protein [Ramlibacter sp.]|uniref:Fic family protein n=1 Tax=Ramlibacter sp. TaxID=1917967 RepID=UPI003D0ABEED
MQTLLLSLEGEQSRQELLAALQLRDRKHFADAYLLPALINGLIKMTIPDKPNSRLQQYRRTAAGRARLKALKSPPASQTHQPSR